MGLTAGDCCPTSHQCREGRQRWSEDMFGIERGGSVEGLLEADVTPSLLFPCLNKSCSRSFYLHMLTGTSEFPTERCREKKMRKKRTE